MITVRACGVSLNSSTCQELSGGIVQNVSKTEQSGKASVCSFLLNPWIHVDTSVDACVFMKRASLTLWLKVVLP